MRQAIKKDPTLLDSTRVVITDTVPVVIPQRTLDASVLLKPGIDTTIEREGVRTRLWAPKDTSGIVRVETICLTDTIYRTVEVQAECPPRVKYIQGKTTWGVRGTWALIGALVCLFLYKRL